MQTLIGFRTKGKEEQVYRDMLRRQSKRM